MSLPLCICWSESKQGLANDMLDWVCEMQKRRKVFSAFFVMSWWWQGDVLVAMSIRIEVEDGL